MGEYPGKQDDIGEHVYIAAILQGCIGKSAVMVTPRDLSMHSLTIVWIIHSVFHNSLPLRRGPDSSGPRFPLGMFINTVCLTFVLIPFHV